MTMLLSARRLVALFLWLAPLAVHAQQPSARARADLVKMMVEDLSKQVSILRKESTFFHWTSRGNRYDPIVTGSPDGGIRVMENPSRMVFGEDEAINTAETGSLPIESKDWIRYFKKLTRLFRKEKYSWMIGGGFYAAMDPVASQAFAGRFWGLMTIAVPAGMKYLDGRINPKRHATFVFRKATADRLREFYDISNETPIDTLMSVRALDYSEFHTPEGRALLADVLKELGVGFIAYHFRDGRDSVNFIDPDWASNPRIKLKLFVDELGENADPVKKHEYEKVLRWIDAFDLDDQHLKPARHVKTAYALTRHWRAILGEADPFKEIFEKHYRGLMNLNEALFADEKTLFSSNVGFYQVEGTAAEVMALNLPGKTREGLFDEPEIDIVTRWLGACATELTQDTLTK